MESDGEKVLSCGNSGNSRIDGWIHPIAILPPAVVFDNMDE